MYLSHGGNPCPQNTLISQDGNKPHDILVEHFDLTTDQDEDVFLEDDDDEELILDEDVVVMIHTTGVFQHVVRWCKCVSPHEQHIDMLRLRLFPATMTRPRTVFSFDVLDHFYADSMECKTSAHSFFNKLCRLTNNAFPQMVPVSCHDIHFEFSLVLTKENIF